MIEKVEIVFQETGKRKKVLVSWLLSQAGQWAFEASPFIVQDNNLAEKIVGQTFNGRPVKELLIARFNYLKTVLNETNEDLYADNATEDEAEVETNQADQLISDLIDIEDIQAMNNIEDVKAFLDSKGVKYDKRKKGIEYFKELALNTIN
jgi:hypothetical protein